MVEISIYRGMEKVKIIKVPCQNCGKLVEVTLNENGYYVGCVFCNDCMRGQSWSAGTESFSKERVF